MIWCQKVPLVLLYAYYQNNVPMLTFSIRLCISHPTRGKADSTIDGIDREIDWKIE